jgi:solute:Na+ symporter, SSS family
MFIYLVSELTALAAFLQIYNLDVIIPQISVCLLTALYTAIGGMPASLLTDKFQGWLVVLMIALATVAVCATLQIDGKVVPGSAPFQVTAVGWENFWTLTCATTAANVFHQVRIHSSSILDQSSIHKTLSNLFDIHP